MRHFRAIAQDLAALPPSTDGATPVTHELSEAKEEEEEGGALPTQRASRVLNNSRKQRSNPKFRTVRHPILCALCLYTKFEQHTLSHFPHLQLVSCAVGGKRL